MRTITWQERAALLAYLRLAREAPAEIAQLEGALRAAVATAPVSTVRGMLERFAGYRRTACLRLVA